MGRSEHERRKDFPAAVQPVQVVPSATQAVRSLLMGSMQSLKRKCFVAVYILIAEKVVRH